MNVVITGASRGIGKTIASVFAANGHHLYISARNEKLLNATKDALAIQYPSSNIQSKAFDLSIKGNAKKLGSWILESCTCVDILVNNAGSYLPGFVYNEAEGVLEEMIQTNLYSAYHLTRVLLPLMIEQKSGHIFNICSIASLQAYPNGGGYSISKFALAGFSKNLREEMKPYGIKVTAVYPGAVLTDSWAGFDNTMNRIMESDDVAKMIYASYQLSYGACVEEIILRPQLGDL